MKGTYCLWILQSIFQLTPEGLTAFTLKSMQCRGLVYLLAIAQSFLFTKIPDGFAHHILLKVLFSYSLFQVDSVENAA